jgi:hypothetical protein
MRLFRNLFCVLIQIALRDLVGKITVSNMEGFTQRARKFYSFCIYLPVWQFFKKTRIDIPIIIMSKTAIRRLMTEYKELTVNAPEGITAGPVTEDNLFIWEGI